MARYHSLIGTVVLVTSAVALPGAASAQWNCGTRHFYNNSSVPFILTMNEKVGTCSYRSSNKRVCRIPAGAVGEIHYRDALAPSRNPRQQMTGPLMTVRSRDGGKIYNKQFSVDPKKCYINHDGNTGNIVVNDPANGDIVTCGGSSYTCR